MHASTQERFKHTVPPQSAIDMFRPLFPHPSRSNEAPQPSNSRINITFRFYRPDFRAEITPRCKCGVPAILRPDMKRRDKLETSKQPPSSLKELGSDNGLKGEEEDVYRYWWTCNAGAQNAGKTCGFWRVMDVDAEGRGPFIRDRASKEEDDR
jgi:hypothetical protein